MISNKTSFKVPPTLRKRIRIRRTRKKRTRGKKILKRRCFSSTSVNKGALYINLMTVLLNLWKKNENLKSCPNVRIPKTYIVIQSYPVSFLFYDEEKEDIILRSEGIGLEPDRVLWNLHSKEIVKGEIRNVLIQNLPNQEKEKCKALTRDNLLELFSKRRSDELDPKNLDGIIQAIIPPETTKDRVYHCKWTPNVQKITLFQQNIPYHLTRSNSIVLSLSDRNSKEIPGMVDMRTKSAILRICEHIVRHLMTTSNLRIAEMELIFKKDKLKRLWLLRTRNVRINRESQNIENTLSSSEKSDHFNIISNHTLFKRKKRSYEKKKNYLFFKCFFCGNRKSRSKNHQLLHTQGRDRDSCKNCYYKLTMNQRGYFVKKMERKWSARAMVIRENEKQEDKGTTFDSILDCMSKRRITSGRRKNSRSSNSSGRSKSCRGSRKRNSMLNWKRKGVVGTVSRKLLLDRNNIVGMRPSTSSGAVNNERKRRWSSIKRSRCSRSSGGGRVESLHSGRKKRRYIRTAVGGRRSSLPHSYGPRTFSVKIKIRKV